MPSLGRFGLFFLAAIPFVAGAVSVVQKAVKPKPVDLAADILPLLKGRCRTCHSGPNPASGMDLTIVTGLKKGGASRKTVIPGDPANSVLIRRLRGLDGKPQMPMGFAPLEEEQIKLIERWIADGAKFTEEKPHWAYVKPVRPSIPAVRYKRWVRNPIDNFILARLEKEGLRPSPEASKEILLRRVTLDLTGLPPTLEEIDAFLKDRTKNAYEKVVDRLLASPHYGERQARIWLDLARYADSNGFEKDYTRTMWKWRDWVINAYNKNMPFDRFTFEQLAGDMLPGATLDQKIASGFHRNTMWNSEGGVDKDEGHFEEIIDRVATTGTVWMAQTFGCARCHDHKYDPIKQKEFYSLYAVWGNCETKVVGDHNVGEDKLVEPEIAAPSPQQVLQKAQLEDRIKGLENEYAANTPELEKERAAWLSAAKVGANWQSATIASADAKNSKFQISSDGSVLPTTPVPNEDIYTVTIKPPPGKWTGLRLKVLPDTSFPQNGPGRASSGNFILSKIEAFDGDGKLELGSPAVDFIQEGYAVKGLLDDNGDTGWAIVPAKGKPHELVIPFKEPVETETIKIVLTQNSPTWKQHVLGRFAIDLTQTPEPQKLLLPADVQPQSPKGEEYFRSVSDFLKPVREQLADSKFKLTELKNQIPTALVLKEKPTDGPLKAPFHNRGEWLNKGADVIAGVPAFLPSLPAGIKVNRLTVAKWLVSPENPLTARVQVNRMWEQYFGRGIVETSDNFGTQGSKPSHPELLDYLATEFNRLNWNMKAIHRLIVTSATYRQSSNGTAALMAKDPRNELLARGPRFRMEAEMIRDASLSAAGLLDPKVGGPSVFPHQPSGIWNSPYSGERWMTSKGGDLYRRGLYTFWKRTSTYPAFMNFDATSREQCTAKRTRTNTPLQALTLLNDEAFLEAAKALGKRMTEAKAPLKSIETGFRLATGRRPTPAEERRLLKLYKDLVAKYEKAPERAEKLAGSPSAAAWTLVASTLLNLDETITKG